MNIYEAYKITRRYNYSSRGMNGMIRLSTKPKLLTEIRIIKNKEIKKHYFVGKGSGNQNYFIRSSSKEFKNIQETIEYTGYNNHLEIKYIKEDMVFCSMGLVTKEKFEMGTDIITKFKKEKEINLILNEKYNGINGKEYTYIGNGRMREYSRVSRKISSLKLIQKDSIWN